MNRYGKVPAYKKSVERLRWMTAGSRIQEEYCKGVVKAYVGKGRFQHSKRVLWGNGKGSGGKGWVIRV